MNYIDLQDPNISKAYRQLRSENTYTDAELENIQIVKGTAGIYLEDLIDEHFSYSDDLCIFGYLVPSDLIKTLTKHNVLSELEVDGQFFTIIDRTKL